MLLDRHTESEARCVISQCNRRLRERLETFSVRNYVVREGGGSERGLRSVGWLEGTSEAIKAWRPDVCVGLGRRAGMLGFAVSYFTETVFVYGKLYYGHFNFVDAFLFRVSDGILFGSAELKRHYRAALREQVTAVVYSAVSKRERVGEPGLKLNLGPRPRIGYLGRVVPVKGADRFVEVAELFERRGKPGHFVIAGGMDQRYTAFSEKIQETAERLPEGRLSLLGHVDCPRVFLNAIDVLVVPSRREGYGRVVVEALQEGTPVLATRCGGPEEILSQVSQSCEHMIVDQDVEAIAAGLEGLLHREKNLVPELPEAFQASRIVKAESRFYREILDSQRTNR